MNALDAGTDVLDHPHPVQHAEQQRIPGHALDAQIRLRHSRRQTTRTDDFDSILEDVNVDVRRRAVITMCHGIRNGFPMCLFRQLRLFVPPHVLDDELDVDLGKHPGHRVVEHRRNVAMEIPSIKNSHFLGAHEQRAGHVSGRGEPANVAGQEPGAGVGHAVLPVQQTEVSESHHPIHGFRNLGSVAEPRPGFVIEIVLDGKIRAGLPVEMKAPDRVEQIFEFRVRHLLTVRRDVHEEAPAEGVGLALLRRHEYAQDSAYALDFQHNWWLRRARGALDPRLATVVVRQSHDLPGV